MKYLKEKRCISQERNIGIDILKIISMLMIVILHYLGHENVKDNFIISPINNLLCWYLEIACYGAVDIYAIITGYLCIKSKHRPERIIEL